MPAITADTLTLPRIAGPAPTDTERPVRSVTTGPRGYEGEGFPVVRAFAGVKVACVGESTADAVRAFGDAGCRYLQLDEVNIAYLCDPEQLAQLRNRGEPVEGLLETYAALINAAVAGRPADMTVSMHLCRGNFRSMHIASGGYDPVAEVLFNRINVDAYFMEYDTERAGSFAPLRFLPRGKTVVLGLVTSKTGELESKDELKRRIDQAARYLPLEQLALSPQCGFASTEEGNLLTVEQQWAKLALCVEVAREVWGGV